MDRYYTEKLSAERLKRCYEIAPPRVQRYLQAEIDHVLEHLLSSDDVLELGCGYGRVLREIAGRARWVTGIDTSLGSLLPAREYVQEHHNVELVCCDASQLGFASGTFDRVVCIQNGISAFHVEKERLLGEAIRVVKAGGTLLFSSYSPRFWDDRVGWFREQAEAGLIGEIDSEKTGNGEIVCRDGFRATTVTSEDFESLARGFNVSVRLVEVDNSSLFCEMTRGA